MRGTQVGVAWLAVGVAVAVLWASAPAWAGGVWVYETGTPDVGTASAGRAATAEDASTAFGNPAGMTRLQGTNLLFGLQPLIATIEFDKGTGTTTSGNNGGDAGGFIPAGAIYGTYAITHDLMVGCAFNSYIGGPLNYDSGWVGRYYGTESTLLTLNLNPVIAYRVLPWLSLGAGFSVQWAKLKQELAVNNVLDALPDGIMKYSDNNVGFGGNFGALFEIDEKTRVGITYRSQVDHGFNDTPSFGQLGPGLEAVLKRAGVIGHSLGIDMTMPQEVQLSAYREITDDLALMANFNWQDWAQFGDVGIQLSSAPPRSLVANANFQDTYQGAIGAHYRLGKPTVLSLGFAYDSAAVDKAHRSPLLPVDQQLRFAVGVQYAVTEDYTLGAAYEYASLGSAPIDTTRGPLTGTLQGDYQTNSLNVFALTVTHHF